MAIALTNRPISFDGIKRTISIPLNKQYYSRYPFNMNSLPILFNLVFKEKCITTTLLDLNYRTK